MNGEEKSKEQLLAELDEMKQLVAQLESAASQCQIMKDEIKEAEETYRAIFDTTGTATFMIQEDTTISLVNSEFEKLSGWNKEDVVGKKSWTEFFTAEHLTSMMSYHRLRRIAPGTAPRNYESQFIDKQGNIHDVLMTVAIIPGTKKSIASILDITDRKRAEKLLRQTQNLSEKNEQDKQQAERELHNLMENKVFLLSDQADFIAIRTAPGYGPALTLAVENSGCTEVLGTIATSDLVLIITKDEEANKTVMTKLKANFVK